MVSLVPPGSGLEQTKDRDPTPVIPCHGYLPAKLEKLSSLTRRVYEAPFLDRPGRQPLWQGSKREEGGLP